MDFGQKDKEKVVIYMYFVDALELVEYLPGMSSGARYLFPVMGKMPPILIFGLFLPLKVFHLSKFLIEVDPFPTPGPTDPIKLPSTPSERSYWFSHLHATLRNT